MKLLAKEALRARNVRDDLKKQLKQQAEDIPEIKEMSLVVGLVTAAVLYAKLGSPSSFPQTPRGGAQV